MLSVVGSISLRGGSRMTTKALGALITAMGVVAGGLPAEAQGPIRIGASLSLTGTYAKLGRNQHEGYKLCEKDLNATGGLLGRKVEFVVYDDQSTPATAVRLYEKLITEDMVDGVMGPYSSPVTKAAAAGAVDITKKKGMKDVFQEAYTKGDTDFAALLTKVKSPDPDIVAAATYVDAAVGLTRQMRELDVSPKAYGVTVGGDLPE